MTHFNGGNEYNDEVGMVTSNLLTATRSAKRLMSMLDRNENLPEWVQEKISKATSMIVSATNYMESQHEKNKIFIHETQLDQEKILTIKESLSKKLRQFKKENN